MFLVVAIDIKLQVNHSDFNVKKWYASNDGFFNGELDALVVVAIH